MDLSLRKFIATRQEKGEGYYTHVSQIQPTGKYNLTRKDDEEWWKLYCDTMYSNPKMVSGLAERPGEFLPVLNDSDIKLSYDPAKHPLDKKLYKDTHIRQTAMIYQKHLKQTVKNYEKRHGICVVLEKEYPTYDKTKEEIKHGYHLHFINAIMHKVDQDVHLIPRVRKEVAEKDLFKDIGVLKSEDVIDKSCTSKFWLLYGSRKKEYLQSYKVTKVFDDDCNEISLEEALKDFKLTDVHGDPVKMDDHPLEYYLPRILSIHPGTREPITVKADLNIITKKLLKKAKESKKVYDDMPTPEALKKARELMKLISAARADNFDDWLDIGWVLFNIGDGTEDALDMWIEFSSKTSKKNFSEAGCVYQWERMEKRNRTIGSLYYYAKMDSPEEYKKIQKKDNDRLFNESLNGGHYDMAKWLHNRYKGEFVCACPEKKVWFHYKNHRWVVNKQGIDLRRKISTELVNEYKNMKKKICEDMGEQDDDAELQKRLKTVNKLIASLKSTPFKNNILSECISAGTYVTMSNGLSVPIEELNNNTNRLIGWDENMNGILNEKQTNFMNKGEKECVELMLSDGTKLVSTHDHPILTSDGRWVFSGDLKPGIDKVRTSITGVKISVMNDMKLCDGWVKKFGSLTLKTDTQSEYEKSLIFSRIIGLMLSDGTIIHNKSTDMINANVSLGSLIDANNFVDDIEILCGKRPKITNSHSSFYSTTKGWTYNVAIPSCVSKNIALIPGISLGRKSTQKSTLPEFLLDNDCPVPIIREFLGGLMGGDGHANVVTKKNTITSVGFSQSKCEEHIDSLQNMMENIVKMFSKCGVSNVNLFNKKKVKNHDLYEIQFDVSFQDILLFSDNIGFRYCTNKLLKLTAACSYANMYNTVYNQRIEFLKELKKISGYDGVKRVNLRNYIDQAKLNVETRDGRLLNDKVIPKYSTLVNNMRNIGEIRYKLGIKPIEYMESIGVKDFFFSDNGPSYCFKRDSLTLPSLVVDVHEIKPVGKRTVYDITVDNIHNFVANGVIVHNCVELFVDDSFIDKLDSDHNLIHFSNGILDLKEMRFRPGRPTDYVSLTTGYDYQEYSWDSQEVIEVDDHFTKVFPDPELKQYWMEYTASLLRGGNSSKTFLNMSGEGDNAKSVNMDLLKLTLGRYMKILPTSLISGKRTQSSQATPEYAGLPGVRFAVLQEPNSKDVINIGILKELSGNDIIYYRGLYKDSQELKPQFKLALVCNKLPKLPCDDPATWNRIRVLPHEACFPKDNVPELLEDQIRLKRFPRDPYFSEKLPKMKAPFMWMMFDTFKKILKDGRMTEPEKVRSATAMYRKQNDVFLQFIMEKIVFDPENEKALMSVVETYNSFKTWFDDSYPNLHSQIPSKEDLRDELTKKWGDLTMSHKWKGYRLRTAEDDEKEGKAIIIREEDLDKNSNIEQKEESLDIEVPEEVIEEDVEEDFSMLHKKKSKSPVKGKVVKKSPVKKGKKKIEFDEVSSEEESDEEENHKTKPLI